MFELPHSIKTAGGTLVKTTATVPNMIGAETVGLANVFAFKRAKPTALLLDFFV
jgi:hypothetical protein